MRFALARDSFIVLKKDDFFSDRYDVLKVVDNKKQGGSGRWQMIGICLGPW
jgi:hypothetical protein